MGRKAPGTQEAAKGGVFVTVGTTSFDPLIAALDSQRTLSVLRNKGYNKLTLQVGRGTHVFKEILHGGQEPPATLSDGFQVRAM